MSTSNRTNKTTLLLKAASLNSLQSVTWEILRDLKNKKPNRCH